MSPNLAAARAVVVDALVELGRYDDADAAAAEMLAVRADLSTLARVSYVAELHGKLDVALTAMQQAAATPGLAPENIAFVDALLGNLLVATGDPKAAADAYARALALVPAHAPSLAGEGRLAVGAGDLDDGHLAVPARGRHPAAARIRDRPGRCPAGGRPNRRGSPQRQARPRRDPAVPGQRGHRRRRSRAVRGRPRRPGGRARLCEGGLRGHADGPRRRRPGLGAPPPRARHGGEEAVRRGAPPRLARPAAPLSRRRDRGGPGRRRRRRVATSTWRSPPTRASPRRGPPRPVGSSIPCPTEPPGSRSHPTAPGLRIRDDSTDGGRDPFSCTRDDAEPRGGPRPATSAGRDRLVYTIKGRRGRRRPPHRGDIRLGCPRIKPPGGAAHRRRSRRRQHGPVRVRQPGRNEQPDHHRQLRPAPGAGRWSELLPVRPGRPLRDQRRQQRQRQGRHQVPVPVQDPSQGQELRRDPDVPLQRRRDHEPERPEPARLADLRRLAQRSPDRLERSRATGQHRPAVDRRLFVSRQRGGAEAVERHAALRRPARRRVLRRPRLDLRPGRAPTVQHPPRGFRSRPSPASMVSAGSTRTRSPSASRSAS